MSLHKVEGHSGLVKDVSTGGVINTDKRAYEAYKMSKAIALRNIEQQRIQKDSIEHLQGEINNIREDINDIRDMLKLLLQR